MAMATKCAIAMATRLPGIKKCSGNSNNEGNGGSGKSNGNGIREGIDNSNEEGNGDGRRGKW